VTQPDPNYILSDRPYSAAEARQEAPSSALLCDSPPAWLGASWAPPGAAGGPAGGALGTDARIVSGPRQRGRVGRAVSQRYALQEEARANLPAWRVASCMRARLDGVVKVMHHPQHGSASYAGLMTCGSVWVCPVCSAKIAARRQAEIEAGVASWRARGGGLLLVTMTLRHKRADKLATLLAALNGAHRWARGGRPWLYLRQEYGIAGAITTRETTVGGNGWHPHLHALWFVEKPLTDDETAELNTIMRERWVTALHKMGANAAEEYGFRIDNVKADDDKTIKDIIPYIVKQSRQWSETDEVIGGGRKQAKAGNMSIAELLKKASKGSNYAKALFVEYAIATKGHNLVVWTPGLRALLGQVEEEKSDAELAAKEEAGGQLVITLPAEQWRMVCYDKARGRLLAALQRGGRKGLEHWFDVHGYPIEPWQWGEPPGPEGG
jgi:hypothetical protein